MKLLFWRKREPIPLSNACVFQEKCGFCNPYVCSKSYALSTCVIFPTKMEEEKSELESRRVIWNRKPDGTRDTYHGEML